MAAKTPSNIYSENIGSLDMTIAEFDQGLQTGDTYASSISNIVAMWGVRTTSAVNGSGAAVALSWTAAGGMIYVSCETNANATLFILRGSSQS